MLFFTKKYKPQYPCRNSLEIYMPELSLALVNYCNIPHVATCYDKMKLLRNVFMTWFNFEYLIKFWYWFQEELPSAFIYLKGPTIKLCAIPPIKNHLIIKVKSSQLQHSVFSYALLFYYLYYCCITVFLKHKCIALNARAGFMQRLWQPTIFKTYSFMLNMHKTLPRL